MRGLQGTGWLWVGAAAAVLVPLLRLDAWILDRLQEVAGLAWGRWLLGALIFGTAAAVYFRSHWGATMRLYRQERTLRAETGRRLSSLADDAERWTYTLRDNLHEVGARRTSDERRRMYLDGAIAHAAKLEEVVVRLRAVTSDLRSQAPASQTAGPSQSREPDE